MKLKTLNEKHEVFLNHLLLGVVVFGFIVIGLLAGTMPPHEIRLSLKMWNQEVPIDISLQIWHFALWGMFFHLGLLFLVLYLGYQVIPAIYKYWRDKKRR